MVYCLITVLYTKNSKNAEFIIILEEMDVILGNCATSYATVKQLAT